MILVRGVRDSEIYGRMIVQYDGNFMIQRKFYKWVEIAKRKSDECC